MSEKILSDKNLKQRDCLTIESRILSIRGKQVLLDRDLADLYEVETKNLNRQVKRNIERFPTDFMFQITKDEYDVLKCQFGTSKMRGGDNRNLPYAFTEQGVAMLSGVLRSNKSIEVNIEIMRAFVSMRHFLLNSDSLFHRLSLLEVKQIQTDDKLNKILDGLDDGSLKSKLGFFFDGQILDAYLLVQELFKRATSRLVIIDDYLDESILIRLSDIAENVCVKMYVNDRRYKFLKTTVDAYNLQYPLNPIQLYSFNKSHDRWLLVDDEIYHFGASFKDLGKKWFSVDRVDEYSVDDFLDRL